MASTYQVSAGDAEYTLEFLPGSAGGHTLRAIDTAGTANDRLAHVLESTIKLTFAADPVPGAAEPFATHAAFDVMIRKAGLDILGAEVGSD